MGVRIFLSTQIPPPRTIAKMGVFDEINDPRRRELISEIAARVDHHDLVEPGFWAFVWLADVDQLEVFTRDFVKLDNNISRKCVYTSPVWTKALKTWASTRDREANLSTTGDAGGTTGECRERDGNRCLLSLGGDCIELVHIFPYPLSVMTGSEQYHEFWETLSTFCQPDRVKEWKDAVSCPQGAQGLTNLMCLASTIHTMWGNAKFALKPVEMSDGGKTLKVEFYWLSDLPYAFKSLETPPDTPHNLDSSPRGTRILNCLERTIIRSGDTVVFKTDDPQRWPLPSIPLLQMQWLLNRMMSITGAADVTDPYLQLMDEEDVDSEEDWVE